MIKFIRHYDLSRRYVTHYSAPNGIIIRSNAGKDIFTSKRIPADFWYVYDKNNNQIFAAHTLKECKDYVVSLF